MRWDPPGKGDWRGLHDHFPRALTAEYQLLLRYGMEKGEAEWFAAYGLPARTMVPAFVHGRVFITAASLIGPPTNRFPPKALMWLAVRAVPRFRRRAAAAERTMATRPWLQEAESWYRDERPAWEARNRELDVVDPAALDDDALAGHLTSARANAYEGYRTHFRLHGADLIPTSMLLGRAIEWGLDPVEVAGLLVGASPASRGGELAPDWRLVTGYDLDERCACELPVQPLAPRRAAPTAHAAPPVSETRRAEWDVLLADARATYGLRDDNGLLTAAWPIGLLRRAMLEAGARLPLASSELAVELTVDELVAGLGGAPVPDAAARRAERRRLSAEPAPASLGPRIDLPLDALPPAMRTITAALLTLRDLGITPPDAGERLHGVGIGTDAVTGRALVALEPAEAFARFEPGDVIVTLGTCPAWSSLLALAGGIVTEEGGPLSHAAIIARELGLPALIGTRDATALIPDGADIEVDPPAGTVRIIA